MRYLYWIFAGLLSLSVQVALSSYLQIWGLKLNLALIVLVILTLRWKSPFLPFYGLMVGTMMDALSHGILGIYGLSFFITLLLTRRISEGFYDQNILISAFLVGVFSVIEGSFAIVLLKFFLSSVALNPAFVKVVLPASLIHVAIAPVLLLLLRAFERAFRIDPFQFARFRYY